MDISSRDSVIIVATFCCVNNFVIFLVHVFPPEGRFNNKEPGHMIYITGVKTFESAVSVIVDIMTIIGAWDMDKRTTTSRKEAHGYRQRLITHLKKPKRALLLFIVWSITSSPASVGTDMVYNYYTSGGKMDLFLMNVVIRCSIEAAKYYVLYRFYRLYNRLETEEQPIIVEGTAKGASPTGLAVTASGGTKGAEAKDKAGAAHFRRRTPYGVGPMPTKSIMAADAASVDPSFHGHSSPVVQGSASLAAWHGISYASRSSSSHPSDIVQDAGPIIDGGGLGRNVEYNAGYDSHFAADLARPGSRKQSYEFGTSSGSAKASPFTAASDSPSPVGAVSGKHQRRPGRRLSIVTPTDTPMHAANVLQTVPEAAPLPDGNTAVVSSSPATASVRSILRNQQNGLPPRQGRYQKTAEEDDVTKSQAALEHVPDLATAEGAATPEWSSELRRKRHCGSTLSSSPDKAAHTTEGTMSHEEPSMTMRTTTKRMKDRMSSVASKRRSLSGDTSKMKHKSSKHSHTASRESSRKKTPSPSTPEESTVK